MPLEACLLLRTSGYLRGRPKSQLLVEMLMNERRYMADDIALSVLLLPPLMQNDIGDVYMQEEIQCTLALKRCQSLNLVE